MIISFPPCKAIGMANILLHTSPSKSSLAWSYIKAALHPPHLPNDVYILPQPQAPAKQSKIPCVKLIQLLRQSLGVFFIYHMAGVFQYPQLRVRNVLGKEMS